MYMINTATGKITDLSEEHNAVCRGLIERLKAATGPDRDLDVDILTKALTYRDIHGDRTLFDNGNEGYWSLDGDEKNPPLPAPTASLGDALQYVTPPKWTWRIERFADGRGRVHLSTCKPVEGATPAIALCIANLAAMIIERAA